MALARSLREGIGVPWMRGAATGDRPPCGGGADPEKRPGILTHGTGNRNFRAGPGEPRWAAIALLALSATCATAAAAPPLVLLVQPPAWHDTAVRFDPAPLAAILALALGAPVEGRVSDDALSHWQAVRTPGGHDLAFEEAHFSAFRIRRHGFVALARAAGEVRFAVVVRPGTLVTSPSDLAARRVAVPDPPAMAALRLLELFPQAARTPRLVKAASLAEALDALARGQVAAAVLPTDAGAPPAGVQVALVTDAAPGRGFTVSARITEAQRLVLLRALTGAGGTPPGRHALAALGVRAMEPAVDAAFEDSERLLRGTWGYR